MARKEGPQVVRPPAHPPAAPVPGLCGVASVDEAVSPDGWPAAAGTPRPSAQSPSSRSVYPNLRVVEESEPTAVPPGGAKPPKRGKGGRTGWSPSGVRAGLLTVAALVGGIWLIDAAGRHHHHAATAVPAPGVPAQNSSANPAGGGLAPITLPPPIGVAPRTQPLTVEWVIDTSLPADPTFTSTLATEVPVDLSYMAAHSLAADRLGFAPADPGQPLGDQAAAAEVAAPETVAMSPPAAPISLPPDQPGRDRAIVIVTDQPAAWSAAVPASPVPPTPTSGAHPPETRWYVVQVAPGSGAHADQTVPTESEPQTLTADPSVRGDLARALARVFVDATGASWS